MEEEGLPNMFELGKDLYSGAQPEGEIAFRNLKELGVKTILSVDGAIPDVDGAAKEGIRYVHLPIGYDGITEHRQEEIIRAVQIAQKDGPVYVHCHHGKHRGVTAAAICAIGLEEYSHEEADACMREAGTGEGYLGLWRAAREFTMPAQSELDQLPTEFPSRAETGDMVKAMNAIDQRWEHLGAIRSAGYVTPSDHPDIDPPHEALQLVELFKEAARLDAAKARGDDFLSLISEAESAAARLREALVNGAGTGNPQARSEADLASKAITDACTNCHKVYRNNHHD